MLQERSQYRTLRNTWIILTFTGSHELKVLLAEVNEEVSSVLLVHVGDARHVEHVLRELVLNRQSQTNYFKKFLSSDFPESASESTEVKVL